MTPGPARRSPAEQIRLCVQLMPLFDSLDSRVRARLREIDVDIIDLITIAKMDPDHVLRLADEWEAADRAKANGNY